MREGESAIAKCLNGEYKLFKTSKLEIARQPEFFDRISTTDLLVLRGIGALLKAEMLATHYEFWEEAIVISFIALEASFQMVLRELRRSSSTEPTSGDAASWLHTTFNELFGLEVSHRCLPTYSLGVIVQSILLRSDVGEAPFLDKRARNSVVTPPAGGMDEKAMRRAPASSHCAGKSPHCLRSRIRSRVAAGTRSGPVPI